MIDYPASNPNGKRIVFALNVDLEIWSEGAAPSYSVQTTGLKPGQVDHGGIHWSQYGGKVGVWRIMDFIGRHDIPATFSVNAKCAEVFPDAVREIVARGYDIAGHGTTQDQLLAYMTPQEERAEIGRCLDVLGQATGVRPLGWVTPVHAGTAHLVENLADAGVLWHADCNYADLPHLVDGKQIVALPCSDFTDNRVLRGNPRTLLDVYKGTFDYLLRREQVGYVAFSLHCQFGGRALVLAVIDELITYLKHFPEIWFARHQDVASWTRDQGIDEGACVRGLRTAHAQRKFG